MNLFDHQWLRADFFDLMNMTWKSHDKLQLRDSIAEMITIKFYGFVEGFSTKYKIVYSGYRRALMIPEAGGMVAKERSFYKSCNLLDHVRHE